MKTALLLSGRKFCQSYYKWGGMVLALCFFFLDSSDILYASSDHEYANRRVTLMKFLDDCHIFCKRYF